jgi:hypothetical protein
MKMLCRFYHHLYLSVLLWLTFAPRGSRFNHGSSPSSDMEFGLYPAFFIFMLSGRLSLLALALEPELNGDRTSLEVFS